MRQWLVIGAIGLASAVAAAGAPPRFAWAQDAQAPADDSVSINYDNADLREVITTISRLTEENFLIDPAVKGTVTIVAPRPVPREEVFGVFQAILELNGYALVPGDNVYKVVPARTAAQKDIPVRVGRDAAGGLRDDELVTQLIPLRYADAQSLSGVLTPLVSRDANMVVYQNTNTIILTDTASNVRRILGIVREIDVSGYEENITVVPLRYAAADQLAQTIRDALEPTGEGPVVRRPRRAGAPPEAAVGGTTGRIKIIPEPRTNALLVVANEIDTQQVMFLVQELDTEAAIEQNNIHVYRLSNSLAPDIAQVLTNLASATPAAGAQEGAPQAQVRTFYREVSVVADEATNSLLLIASPQDYATLRQVIEQLDVRRPQVLVEALIAEVSLDFAQSLGIRWAFTAGSGTNEAVFGGVNQSPEKTALGNLQDAVDLTDLGAASVALPGALPAGATIGALDLDMGVLRVFIEANANETDGDVNILSAPHVMTLDNEEARIVVADSVPFVTSTLTDTGGSGDLAQSANVEFRDVGITLELTPHIAPDGTVRLEIHQEVNEVGEQFRIGTQTATNTELKREVTTVVLVNDQHTIVIGGLIRESDRVSVSKVPVLGDVPVLGWLFKNRNTSREKRNLLVFITPTIVQSLQESERVTRAKLEEGPEDMLDRFRDAPTYSRSRTFAPLGPEEIPVPQAPSAQLPPTLQEAPVK